MALAPLISRFVSSFTSPFAPLSSSLSVSRMFSPFVLSLFLTLFEFAFSIFIIHRVAYTEIDWEAYMSEVSGFLDGELDYQQLKGGTGPLVYPAGFVYLYSAFYFLTNLGQNILLAQYAFAALYATFQYLLFRIYTCLNHSYPVYLLVLLCLSKRIHSIFVLRLFNDCWAMIFMYAAIYILITFRDRASQSRSSTSASSSIVGSPYYPYLASLCFTLGVSIKMNGLLFLPAFGILLLEQFGVYSTILHCLLMLIVQLILGAPFLLTYPHSYIGKAFEFSREFFYIWSVNLKIFPEPIFLSKTLHSILLILHLLTLIVLLHRYSQYGILGIFRLILVQTVKPFGIQLSMPKKQFLFPGEREQTQTDRDGDSTTIVRPSTYIIGLLFLSNFAGIVFSRSLHFQFYVWYFHSIPFLLWSIPSFPVSIRLILFFAIEWVWNVFPSNFYSSLVLNVCHLIMLAGLLRADSIKRIRGLKEPTQTKTVNKSQNQGMQLESRRKAE